MYSEIIRKSLLKEKKKKKRTVLRAILNITAEL